MQGPGLPGFQKCFVCNEKTMIPALFVVSFDTIFLSDCVLAIDCPQPRMQTFCRRELNTSNLKFLNSRLSGSLRIFESEDETEKQSVVFRQRSVNIWSNAFQKLITDEKTLLNMLLYKSLSRGLGNI